MSEDDYGEFSTLLDRVCDTLSRGRYTPNPENTALWFRSLAAHPIAEIRAGFDAHVKDPERGRYVPSPADILAQITERRAADGRLGPEEAWTLALQAADEARTIVWTEEIAQAWNVCRVVLEAGDKVGARMAFKEAYARLVDNARAIGRPAQWSASLGADPAQRDLAIAEAHQLGRLPAPEPLHALPAPDHALSPTNRSMPEHVRERLMALRDRLAGREPPPPNVPGRPSGNFRLIDPNALPPAMRGEASA